MTTPDLLGRGEEDDTFGHAPDVRAQTALTRSESIPFEAGALGKVNVDVFTSNGDGDRGGIVVRITIDDRGSSFIPHAVLVPNGVELHVAGDIESNTVATALVKALSPKL